MKPENILELLGKVEAIIPYGHFVYTSGRHGKAYVNKDAIYPDTRVLSAICEGLAQYFFVYEVDTVVAPAIGGVALTQWTTHHVLSPFTYLENEAKAIFAEKGEDGKFVFKRGYAKFVPGKRVLVVEDVMTTGGTVKEVVELIRSLGGEVIGVSVICNRGGVTAADLGVPVLRSLIDLPLESWPADECPLCQRGVPINTDFGHGREFLASQAR